MIPPFLPRERFIKPRRILVPLWLLTLLFIGGAFSAVSSQPTAFAVTHAEYVTGPSPAPKSTTHLSHSLASGQGTRQTDAPGIALPLGPQKTNQPGATPGIYYLDYGYNTVDPARFPVDGSIRFWPWSALNPAPGVYDWAAMDNWLAARKALGLKSGIMITTYDGIPAGDIRSTPDYVIETPGAVVPVNIQDTTLPDYVPTWPLKRTYTYNANFDALDHDLGWTMTGSAAIVDNPPIDPERSAAGWAAKLGGANNAIGSLYHFDQRFPAMPPDLAGTVTARISIRVYISTTDPDPNDHLLLELWDPSNKRIGDVYLDVTNKSHPNKTWQDYSLDISSIAHKRIARVAFKVITDSTHPTTFYVDNVSPLVRHLVPYYHGKNWTTTKSSPYFDAYKVFIQALGDHLQGNPDMQFVAIGTGVFAENQPVEDHYNYVMTDLGMTSAIWTEYVNEVTTTYVNAFSSEPDLGLKKQLLLQYAPVFLSASERREQTAFAVTRNVGLSANLLMADYVGAYRPNGTGAYDPIYKWQQQVPIAFEAYATDLCSPVLTYWAVVGSLDKHVDYLRTADGLLRNAEGEATANVPVFAWAQRYVGRSAEEAPSAWVVMREHRNPMQASCRGDGVWYLHSNMMQDDYSIAHGTGAANPELGNFDFLLQQVDNIAGGRTVAETNDKGSDSRFARDPVTGMPMPEAGLGNCPPNGYSEAIFGADYPCNYQPYNPDLPPLVGQNAADYRDFYNVRDWTGEGKEAWIVRRTDQNANPAKNNPFMFFQFDDTFIDGSQTYSVALTVKYFDIGTDQWQLKYDSVSGEKAAVGPDGKHYIQKAGTKNLMEVTFNIPDGKFAGRLTGGADFYLDSRSAGGGLDGNEWVHMVDVARRNSAPKPTPTPTFTSTPASTPSAGGVDAVFASAPPVLDGHLGEWSGVSPVRLNAGSGDHHYLWGETPTLADLSAELRSAWTASHLYFALSIQDDVLVGNNSSKIWGDDIIEISIYDPANNTTHQFAVAVDGRQAEQGNLISTLNPMTSTIPGGWSVEIAVPALAVGQTQFAEGQQYPFTFGLWDDDKFTYPGQTHLIWRSDTTNTYEPDWGVFRLKDIPYDFSPLTPSPDASTTPAQTPSATPTATGTPTATLTPSRTPTPAGSPTPTATPPPTITATATSAPRSIAVVQAARPPTIDGDLAEWGELAAMRLDATAGSHSYLWGEAPKLADLSAELHTAWMSNTLYFAATLQDDILVGNNSAQIWGDDVIELSIYEPVSQATHMFTLALDGRQAENGTAITALTMVTSTIPGGWAVEAAIPAAALGVSDLLAEQQYPFTFALWDDDRFTYPGQTHLFWQSSTANRYRADWGILQLSSTTHDFLPMTVVPGASPTATSTRTPSPTSSRTPTATATLTWTPAPTPTPSATPTATATRTPTASATPSRTTAPTWTPSPTPTPSTTPTATATRTPTASATPSRTATPSWTPSPTPTASMTPTATATRTPTASATPSRTLTPTSSHSATPSATPTWTPSVTPTPSATPTATATRTPTASVAPSATPTSPPSATPTMTATATETPTPLATPSATPTSPPSATLTRTPTMTVTPTPTSTPSQTPTATPATGDIEGTVFNDANHDTTPGPDEPRLQGVEIFLMRGKEVRGYATTSASGHFGFHELAPGQWSTTLWLPMRLALVAGENPSSWIVEPGKMSTRFFPVAMLSTWTPTLTPTSTSSPTLSPTTIPSVTPSATILPNVTPTATPTRIKRGGRAYLPLLLRR